MDLQLGKQKRMMYARVFDRTEEETCSVDAVVPDALGDIGAIVVAVVLVLALIAGALGGKAGFLTNLDGIVRAPLQKPRPSRHSGSRASTATFINMTSSRPKTSSCARSWPRLRRRRARGRSDRGNEALS